MVDQDTQVASPSLHDDLTETYNQMTAEEPVEVSEPVAEVEAPSGGQPRDEQGRFAKVESDDPVDPAEEDMAPQEAEAEEVEVPETGEEIVAPEVASDEEPDGTSEQLEAPHHWTAENKEEFSTLPDASKKFILRRQGEMDAAYTKKSMDLADERKFYESMQPVLTPLAQEAAAKGIGLGEAIGRLYSAQRYLESSPVEGIKWLAQSYGVDLGQFAPQPNMTQQSDDFDLDSWVDPQIAELQQSVNSRLDSMDQILKRQQQQEAQARQRQQQQMQAHTQQSIEAFVLATDEHGTLKHPFYQDVESDMIPLVANMREQNPGLSNSEILEAAYEKAIWANPETRARLQGQVTEQAKRENDEKRKAEAAKAKKAALPKMTSGEAGAEPAPDQMSLRDELAARYESLAG